MSVTNEQRKALGDAMMRNMAEFYRLQPDGPTEFDICVDTVIDEGWTPPRDRPIITNYPSTKEN